MLWSMTREPSGSESKRIDGGGMMRVRHKLAVVGVDNTGETSLQLVN